MGFVWYSISFLKIFWLLYEDFPSSSWQLYNKTLINRLFFSNGKYSDLCFLFFFVRTSFHSVHISKLRSEYFALWTSQLVSKSVILWWGSSFFVLFLGLCYWLGPCKVSSSLFAKKILIQFDWNTEQVMVFTLWIICQVFVFLFSCKVSNELYRFRETGKTYISDMKVFIASKLSFEVRCIFGTPVVQ